ncbi:MAG: glycine dehydrogenase, partial [Pseudomonadota bacterium]
MPYIPHTESEISEMLKTVGVEKLDDLFRNIPDKLKVKGKLGLPDGMVEIDLVRHMTSLASKNKMSSPERSFIGAGAYRHYVPSAVSQLASRSEFVTPYTPYQPEVSQGTLQAIFEYQSLMCRLFAMDVSNASHYDGPMAL